MGHRSLQPSRVHQAVTRMIETHNLAKQTRAPTFKTPTWYKTLGRIPPPEILVRPQPARTREISRKPKTKKPSKLFRPEPIVYAEDGIRQMFYREHPWELARPRVILEQDGKDGQRCDWSQIIQPGQQLCGESVVQRAKWLLDHGTPEGMKVKAAYDQARQEFYAIRYEQEVERRVAKEEALSTGAYFGKSRIEIGLELEDKVHESWKQWSLKEIAGQQQRNESAYTGIEAEADADGDAETSTDGAETTATNV